jgi:hypothetical protein
VIQGNLDVVRELLGPAAQRVRGQLRLTDEQIERKRLIVTQMLQFARPGEFSGDLQAVGAAQALDDSQLLVERLRTPQGVCLQRRYTATRAIGGEPPRVAAGARQSSAWGALVSTSKFGGHHLQASREAAQHGTARRLPSIC